MNQSHASLSQSRAMSLVEAVTNVGAGYCIALATQLLLFPVLGLHLSTGKNAAIAAIFTFVSIARSYCFRRLFERVRLRT